MAPKPERIGAATLLAIVAATYGRYGFTTDELIDFRRAQRVYDFLASRGADSAGVSKFDVNNFYGAMPDLLALFLQKLVRPLSYDSRHLGHGVLEGGARRNEALGAPPRKSQSVGHTTPEVLDLDSAFLFSSPVYTLLLIAKGFYQGVRLAKASSLNRAAYERYRAAARNARPGQLAGLISQAEFLKTGGKAPVDPLAGLFPAPAFGPTSTRIKLPTQPAFPPVRRKPKG